MWGRLASVIAAVVVSIASIVVLSYVELSCAIDFRGGTLVTLHLSEKDDPAALRSALTRLGLGQVAVESLGSPRDVRVCLSGTTWNDDLRQKVQAMLDAHFAGAQIRRVEVVGPRVAGELRSHGQLAIALALGCVLFWIWWRFGWQFGVALALAHLLQLSQLFGLYAVTQLPFGLGAFVTILLLIVLSLVQTIVIFSCIHRLMQGRETTELSESVHLGVRRRLLPVAAIFLAAVVVGMDTSQSIVIATVGAMVGTLASIFVAPAIMALLMENSLPKIGSTTS